MDKPIPDAIDDKEKIETPNGNGEQTEIPSEVIDIEQVQSETVEKKTAIEVQTEILDRQENQFNGHPHRNRFIKFSERKNPKKNPLSKFLKPKERIFAGAFSNYGRYYVPKAADKASKQDIEDFYENLPLDPTKFPDLIFERFFNHHFPRTKQTPEGLEMRDQHMQLVREMFQMMKPLTARFAKHFKNQSKRMFVLPFEGENKGSILVARKPNRRSQVLMTSRTIYEALRAYDHIDDGYQALHDERPFIDTGELGHLSEVRERISALIGFLQSEHKNDPEKQRLSALEIANLEQFFFGDINELKQEAEDKLGEAKSFYDRLGRLNLGKSSAQLVAGKNRVNLRKKQIRNIIAALEKDKGRLVEIRDGFERVFAQIYKEVSIFISEPFFEEFIETSESPRKVMKVCGAMESKLRKPFKIDATRFFERMKYIAEADDIPAPFCNWAEAVLSNFRVFFRLNQSLFEKARDLDEKTESGKNEGKPLTDEEKQANQRDLIATHDKLTEYAIRGQLALRFQHLQKVYMSVLSDIVEYKGNIGSVKYFEPRLREALTHFDPHSFNRHFLHRPDLNFTVDFYDDMRNHVKELLEIIEEWVQQNADLNIQINNEESYKKKRKLKKEKNDIKWEYINMLYEAIKEFDFNEIIEVLTVRDLKGEVNKAKEQSKEMNTPAYDRKRMEYAQELVQRGIK